MSVSRASAAFAGLPGPVRGAILAVTASAFFAGMIGCIRVLAEHLPLSWPRFLWTPHCPLEPRRNSPHERQSS
jgi:hypothetical protein